jgi:hypothetical protein
MVTLNELLKEANKRYKKGDVCSNKYTSFNFTINSIKKHSYEESIVAETDSGAIYSLVKLEDMMWAKNITTPYKKVKIYELW